jgi:hypothetical protein
MGKHRKLSPTYFPEYQIWKNMIQRCYYPKDSHYHWYGERGIIVCDRWRKSFRDFLMDVGFRPSPELTLDRIDNDGNYEKLQMGDNFRSITQFKTSKTHQR